MPSIWFAFCSSDAGGAIITHSDATSNDIRILMWVIGALVITLIGIFIAFCCVMYLKHAPEDDEPKKKKDAARPNNENKQDHNTKKRDFNSLSEEEQKLILQHRLEALDKPDHQDEEQ